MRQLKGGRRSRLRFSHNYEAARLDTPAAEYAGSPEDTFEVGLAAILDGFEVRRPAGAGERSRPSRV